MRILPSFGCHMNATRVRKCRTLCAPNRATQASKAKQGLRFKTKPQRSKNIVLEEVLLCFHHTRGQDGQKWNHMQYELWPPFYGGKKDNSNGFLFALFPKPYTCFLICNSQLHLHLLSFVNTSKKKKDKKNLYFFHGFNPRYNLEYNYNSLK